MPVCVANLTTTTKSNKFNCHSQNKTILAERIGLEPMDHKTRSQISNLLHYHSANAPHGCDGYYTETVFRLQVIKL